MTDTVVICWTQNNIGNVITDKGFIIEANDVIYVSIRVRSAISNSGQKFHAGALVSKGNSLFVWKKEIDKWRIFRDVYKPQIIE